MSTRLALVALLCLAPLDALAQDAEDTDSGPGDEMFREPVAEPEADAPADEPPVEEAEPTTEPTATPEPAPVSDVAGQVRQREELRPWHVAFGTATGIATYATTILGFLTYHDRYGFTGNGAESGCGTGSAIFGMAACNEPPWSHLITASTTMALFAVTFTLALFMPDPLDVAGSGGEQGTLLTVHKILRWGLLGLFVAQLALGLVTSAVTDYETQRGLAVTHLVLGVTTNLTMTTQGILGSIMEW